MAPLLEPLGVFVDGDADELMFELLRCSLIVFLDEDEVEDVVDEADENEDFVDFCFILLVELVILRVVCLLLLFKVVDEKS